jgi:pimeloyl-ACP methyl ester carboxylesterase
MSGMAETVVLVHGIYMSGFELGLLRRRVAQAGFDACIFRYRSLLRPVAENALRLAAWLEALDATRLHLVGHSLGGLVILRMFDAGVELPPGRVVFLGAPVRGSRTALDLAGRPWGPFLLGRSGPAGLTEQREAVWKEPRELGVIAGSCSLSINPFHTRLPKPHDGMVSVDETRIAGAKDELQLNVTHTGMLFNRELAEQVTEFLKDGRFKHG